jgi:hypothetical protein
MIKKSCDEVAVISSPFLGLAGLQQAVWNAIRFNSEEKYTVLGVSRELAESITNENLLPLLLKKGIEIRHFSWTNANPLKRSAFIQWVPQYPNNSNLLLAGDSKISFHDIKSVNFLTQIEYNDFLFHPNVEKKRISAELLQFFSEKSLGSIDLKWPHNPPSLHRAKRKVIDDLFDLSDEISCFCVVEGLHLDDRLVGIMEVETREKCSK